MREIKPTIPWIALPNRIALFGGGVPGAICDGCRRNGSTVYVSGRTVDNDITRSSVYRQRWRIERFYWGECVGVIVDVSRIEKSKKLEGMKAEKTIQVEMLEERLQFLGGGHRLRLSV